MSSLAEILSLYPKENKSLLLPLFQEVQEKNGYVSMANIIEVAEYFSIPSEVVYSTLSFYPQFRFSPKGKYHIETCNQCICRMNDSDDLELIIKRLIGINPGEISSDALYSYDYGMCVGICKPHVRINGNIQLLNKNEELKEIIEKTLKQNL